MSGSRSYSSRPGQGETSLDALNRTIEGLEARIETILGRGGANPSPSRPVEHASASRSAPLGTGAELLEGIRARQKAIEGARRGATPASTQATATPEISQILINEMAALRREMRELRSEAREQALPEELHRDLAGIAASIDALGTQDTGTDSLRLELDSMRAMVDRLAREDSIQALGSRWQAMEERVSGLDIGGLRDELVSLAYRVDDIREVLAAMPASGESRTIERKIDDLSRAIETMTRQPAQTSGDLPRQFEMLGGRLDEITRAIAAMPAAAVPALDYTPFERLEARLASVAQKIDELEPAAGSSDLGGRIEHLAARVAQLADEEAVARLDARIERLHALVEQGARQDEMPELAEYLSDISNKIEALDARSVDQSLIARLDKLAQQIDSLSAPVADTGLPEAAIGRLEALIGRAEATASRAVDPLPGLETLDAKLGEIASKLKRAEETAAGIAMQPMSGLENIEAQLSDISARLNQAPVEAAPVMIPGIENLEARLTDIAERLDMTSQGAGAGDDALRALEEQIANLSQQISSTPANLGGEAFDERFATIEEHLATSDEFVVEAARQAAESALAAYAGQMGSSPSPQSLANVEVIGALADDLKALETLSRTSDDRTMRAFEAVQETLLKIADRLEHLDVASPAAGRAALSGMREAVADARDAVEAAMPAASTEAMDHAMDTDLSEHDAPAMVDRGQQARQALSPSEAAAQAAAHAIHEQAGEEADDAPAEVEQGEKSFLSGLAARIRPGKDTPRTQAEPRFVEENAPPLDPAMEIDPQTANMPLEPGSGAPDINRILQKVREAQAAERQLGDRSEEEGSEKAEFLASARRAAQAAAAEVETIGKAKKSSGGGLLAALKASRRPILLAAGAVLLVVMSYPLVTNFLNGGGDNSAVETAIVDQAPQDQAPLDQAPAIETPAAEPRLPEVRLVEPGAELPTVDMPAAMPDTGAAATPIEPSAAAPEAAVAEPDAGALAAALDALTASAANEALKAAAQAGDPLALYEIGARFTEGRGAPVDLEAAAVWYQRAADLGHAPSQYRIANFYEKGSGLPRDLDAAKKWYQMAAEQGNASAMHNLAVLYATAGGAPDFDNAAEWFTRAAEVGVRDSQVNLAILYARGDGVPRDLEQSYKWFAIAANDGDKDAAAKRDEVFNALRPEQAEAARAAVANWTAEPINPDANTVEVPASWGGASNETASVDMSKAIRNIQAILNNNGFDAGPPDGVMGKKTEAAIKAFQSSIGLEATGEIDDQLVRELLKRNG